MFHSAYSRESSVKEGTFSDSSPSFHPLCPLNPWPFFFSSYSLLQYKQSLRLSLRRCNDLSLSTFLLYACVPPLYLLSSFPYYPLSLSTITTLSPLPPASPFLIRAKNPELLALPLCHALPLLKRPYAFYKSLHRFKSYQTWNQMKIFFTCIIKGYRQIMNALTAIHGKQAKTE